MGGGVFIALKLADLLLRRYSLTPQLTSEERAFVERLYLRKKDISNILILAYKSTSYNTSLISSVRMTISLVSRILDSGNMDFVEIEH